MALDTTPNFQLPLPDQQERLTPNLAALAYRLDDILASISGISSRAYFFGRNARISNAYLRMIDGGSSNLSGYPITAAGNIVLLAGTMQRNTTSTIEIWKRGGGAPITTLSFVNQTFSVGVVSVPVILGDQIQCRTNGTSWWPQILVAVI
jgi:hypothetical protein